MSLFQRSVLKKYLNDLNKDDVKAAWEKFRSHFHNPTIQQHIGNSKEEEYQEGFVRDHFVNGLGYTLKPQPDFNFVLEQKSNHGCYQRRCAIIKNDKVTVVIELKDTYTTDFDKVEKQSVDYKHRQALCVCHHS